MDAQNSPAPRAIEVLEAGVALGLKEHEGQIPAMMAAVAARIFQIELDHVFRRGFGKSILDPEFEKLRKDFDMLLMAALGTPERHQEFAAGLKSFTSALNADLENARNGRG